MPYTLVERGAGLDCVNVNDLVADDEHVYRVTSMWSTIHTDDRPGRGNYVYAELEVVNGEFDEDDLRPVGVEVR